MIEDREVYYRYEDFSVGNGYFDECGEHVSTGFSVRVIVHELPVLKRTAKGVWIRDVKGCKRFVLDGTRKKYAASTLTEALKSFKARKSSQEDIHRNRAERAREAIRIAEKGRKKDANFSGFLLV